MTDIEFAESLLRSVENGEVEIHPQNSRLIKWGKSTLVLYLECEHGCEFADTILIVEEEMHEAIREERVHMLMERKLGLIPEEQYEQLYAQKKERYTYLMIDHRNGMYKIGRSKHPEYREKTLQSEVPQIELISYCIETKLSEKELHRVFAHKRVRGEWFSLNKSDVSKIIKMMQA